GEHFRDRSRGGQLLADVRLFHRRALLDVQIPFIPIDVWHLRRRVHVLAEKQAGAAVGLAGALIAVRYLGGDEFGVVGEDGDDVGRSIRSGAQPQAVGRRHLERRAAVWRGGGE